MNRFFKNKDFGILLMLVLFVFMALAGTADAIVLKNTFVRTSAVAGEALSVGDIVCIKAADGLAYKAKSDVLTQRPAIGVVSLAAAQNAGVAITTSGIFSGYTALTKGAPVYLDTAGNATQTQPAIWSQQIGMAITATQIKFDFTQQVRPPYVDATTHTATNTTTDGTSITMPASTFAAGRTVKITCGGTITGANAAKNVILYIDDAAILTAAVTSTTTGNWTAVFIVGEHTDLAHQKAYGFLTTSVAADAKAYYGVDTTNFATAKVIKTQVQSSHGSDTITQEYALVEHF